MADCLATHILKFRPTSGKDPRARAQKNGVLPGRTTMRPDREDPVLLSPCC
ncbi:hypothetical protein J2805_000547 [Arthrobacter oryzae]|nr:hypothetical protein [Arthrobacter oryzae]